MLLPQHLKLHNHHLPAPVAAAAVATAVATTIPLAVAVTAAIIIISLKSLSKVAMIAYVCHVPLVTFVLNATRVYL